MAQPNYQQQKKRRELEKKKKNEVKRERKGRVPTSDGVNGSKNHV